MIERPKRSWQAACYSALKEPDPDKALPLLESSLCQLEKRYAEWGSIPGTQEELDDLLRTIAALRQRSFQIQRERQVR